MGDARPTGWGRGPSQVWIGFADPCGLPTHPSWLLRNLLVLLKVQFHLAKVTVVALRENPGKNDISRSIVLDVVLGDAPDLVGTRGRRAGAVLPWDGRVHRLPVLHGRTPGETARPTLEVGAPCPKAIGWEKNEQDKLQPRTADLGPMMDPIR